MGQPEVVDLAIATGASEDQLLSAAAAVVPVDGRARREHLVASATAPATFNQPSGILNGRIIGLGAQVRW